MPASGGDAVESRVVPPTRERRTKPIRVFVADKGSLVRDALKERFGRDPRFHLVATADDGERFLDGLRRFAVDVGVIGWEMPAVHGREVLERLAVRAGAPRVVVYTGHPSPDVPREVMERGGAGFCSKSRPPEELLETVAAVGAGRMVFPMIDVRTLGTSPLEALTRRERQLLAALCEGATNSELARRFDISVQTVKFHLKNVYLKAGVSNRAQAVALYLSRTGSETSPKG